MTFTPREIRPVSAFTLYDADDGVILLQHPLSGKDGRIEIGAGKPISIGELMDALDGLRMDDAVESSAGFVPKGVFYMTQSWIGWEVPARVALLRIKKQEVMAPLPRLLLFSDGEDLRVCAVRHGSKLEPSTPVYHAPLLNVYGDGTICWGSVKKPQSASIHNLDRKAWEVALIESVGTHVNHSHTLTLSGDGKDEVNTAQYVNFMLSLTKERKFPNDNLAGMGMTLGQFVRSFRE